MASTKSEMIYNNTDKWSKIDAYEDNVDNVGLPWPLQGEETIGDAFLALLATLPPEIVQSKELSELEILTLAMEYIKGLENVLNKEDWTPKVPDVKG